MTSPRALLRTDPEEQLNPAPGDTAAASFFMVQLIQVLFSDLTDVSF